MSLARKARAQDHQLFVLLFLEQQPTGTVGALSRRRDLSGPTQADADAETFLQGENLRRRGSPARALMWIWAGSNRSLHRSKKAASSAVIRRAGMPMLQPAQSMRLHVHSQLHHVKPGFSCG